MSIVCKIILTVAAATITFVGVAAEAGSKQACAPLAELLEKAENLAARGDSAAACAIYKQASIDHPDAAEAWAALGEYYRFYAHDEKAASSAFEKALAARQQDPNATAFAWRGLGEIASKAQKDELAVEYFKKSLSALPLADTYRSLCHLYCRQRNFKAAAEQAREAVKLDPSDPIALLLFAAQLHRSGERDEGRRQFEQALSTAGMDAQGKATGTVHCCVVYNAAGYLAVCGDDEAALRMLRKFLETPNHRHLTRTEIESDPDFETLKTKTEFHKLLDTSFAVKRVEVKQ